MKKLLALVLALVMTLSLAVVGSNAAFKDADKVSATYAEAVDVLAGMKVFQGYTDGSFQPEGSITRAEVAAIVYRLYTGDVTDKQASLYATYNKFNDMDGASWAKGYIGYCGNAGLVKGYDAKTFGPSDKVTGYQALAMILRAVGYDKNNEFTGADWQLHVAQYAQQLGILKNVKGEDLNAAASRQLVAELLFQTAAKVHCVNYTAALGYTDTSSILGPTKNATLGEKNFGLKYTESNSDEFGRPYYVWYDARDTKDGNYVALTSTLYATVKATPVKTYTEAVTECQVAEDYGFKATKEFTVYTNGFNNSAKQTLNAINTVNKIGAQGRLTEVYKDRIVMIDTLLAKVTNVTKAVFDAAGHLSTPSSITLEIYDGESGSIASDTYKYYDTTTTIFNDKVDYTYAKGDYVLVYAVQADKNVSVGGSSVKISAVDESTTYKHIEINGVAKSIVGAQSTIWNYASKHVIGGTDYNDNNRFHFDQACKELTNHTWFMDSYGNLIGAANIVSNNYAVLVDIIYNKGTTTFGNASATLMDLAGNKSTVTVSNIDSLATTYSPTAPWGATTNTTAYDGVHNGRFDNTNHFAYVSDDWASNKAFWGYALYRVDTNLDGSVNLVGNGAVQYVQNANFDAYGSAILSGSTVKTYVNNATQYVICTKNTDGTFSYANITGTQAMSAYAKADLFFVADEHNIAKYVYIKDGVQGNSNHALVSAIKNIGHTGPVTEGVNTVYSMEVLYNGEKQIIKTNVTNSGLLETLRQNPNKLYYAEFDTTNKATYGYLTSLTLIDRLYNGNTSTTEPLTYGTSKVVYMASAYYDNGVLINNDTSVGGSFMIDQAKIRGAYTGEAGSAATIFTADSNILKNNAVWVVYTPSVYNTASYVYVGAKPTSTAAAAETALTGKTLTDIELTDATFDSVKAAAVAAAQKKLSDEKITGVTVALDSMTNTAGTSTVPAVGSTDNCTFKFTLTDASGATATNVSCSAKVVNKYSSDSLNAKIKSTVEGIKTVQANFTKDDIVNAVKTALTGANIATTDLTFNVTIPAGVHAGDKVVVEVTGKVGTIAVNVVGADVIVQA